MQQRIAQYSSTFHHTDFECMYFDDEFGGKENLIIHTCPDGSKCEFIGHLNEDMNTFVQCMTFTEEFTTSVGSVLFVMEQGKLNHGG